MTGFYLCFKILTLLAAVFYPRAVTLRETSSVSIFIYDDFANIDGSHLVNLDSVSKMGSFGTPLSIRTIISHSFRTQAKTSASRYGIRTRVLTYVPLAQPIPVLMTGRKPTHYGIRNSLLGRIPLSRELKVLNSEESPRSRCSSSSKGRAILNSNGAREFTSNSRGPSNNKIVSLQRVDITKTKSAVTTVLPRIFIHNMRSLNDDKFIELKSLVNKYDLFLLTETWLTEAKEKLYSIDGFTLHSCHRSKRSVVG